MGVAGSFRIAAIVSPHWPGLCDETIIGAPCRAVAVRAMAGYGMMALGSLTIILGPIAGAFLDVAINGARWETPRGTENIITNMPILVGAIYLMLGIVIVASI